MTDNSSDTVRDEVVRADEQFTQAAIQVDPAAFESIASDDYIFIIKYEALTSEDVKVRVYGDTAILTARITGRGSARGEDFSGQFFVTRVFVKRGGRWMVVSGQATHAKG
jgi:hypothetical protein